MKGVCASTEYDIVSFLERYVTGPGKTLLELALGDVFSARILIITAALLFIKLRNLYYFGNSLV
jgi:hypothetical protein